MKSYFDKVHTWGRISCITTICVLFLVPVLFCIHYNAWPPLQGVLKGLAAVMPLYWATAVAEVDALCSLAVVAVRQRYCRPTVDDSGVMKISGEIEPEGSAKSIKVSDSATAATARSSSAH